MNHNLNKKTQKTLKSRSNRNLLNILKMINFETFLKEYFSGLDIRKNLISRINWKQLRAF
jgi:hypothetical protein